MLIEVVSPYFRIDALAEIMMGLVAFIGTLVWLFARRYLEGDRQYRRFSWQLIALCLSVMGLLAADNILRFQCLVPQQHPIGLADGAQS